ncbi:MAG TPA: GNAT family N-acetyltransferase [Polyangiaceae bacterium]
MRVTPLTPELLGAWGALFEASASACFCRWWHFEGTKNEWLARCFEDPARNRAEQAALVDRGAIEARGLLAMEDDAPEKAVGWMKLAPRALLPKLRKQGAYRAVDLGDDGGVWSVGCLLVRPDRRRHGVARALVQAAPDAVRAWGGRAVEAYPHRVSHALHDEEAWMGPEGIFVTEGWQLAQLANEAAPYPVYRKLL